MTKQKQRTTLESKSPELLDRRLAAMADLAEDVAPAYAAALRDRLGKKPIKRWTAELLDTIPDERLAEDGPPAKTNGTVRATAGASDAVGRALVGFARTFSLRPDELAVNANRKRVPHLEDRLFMYMNMLRKAVSS